MRNYTYPARSMRHGGRLRSHRSRWPRRSSFDSARRRYFARISGLNFSRRLRLPTYFANQGQAEACLK